MSLINSKTWLLKCKRSAKIYHAWGYMIKKIKIGKYVGFSLKKKLSLFFFYTESIWNTEAKSS